MEKVEMPFPKFSEAQLTVLWNQFKRQHEDAIGNFAAAMCSNEQHSIDLALLDVQLCHDEVCRYAEMLPNGPVKPDPADGGREPFEVEQLESLAEYYHSRGMELSRTCVERYVSKKERDMQKYGAAQFNFNMERMILDMLEEAKVHNTYRDLVDSADLLEEAMLDEEEDFDDDDFEGDED